MVFYERLGPKDVGSDEVHIEVPLSKEGSFSENHAELEQAPMEQ